MSIGVGLSRLLSNGSEWVILSVLQVYELLFRRESGDLQSSWEPNRAHPLICVEVEVVLKLDLLLISSTRIPKASSTTFCLPLEPNLTSGLKLSGEFSVYVVLDPAVLVLGGDTLLLSEAVVLK